MIHDELPTIVKPQPCTFVNPSPSEEETRERFETFANAFMVKHNLTEAFEYVSSIYIVRVPLRHRLHRPKVDIQEEKALTYPI